MIQFKGDDDRAHGYLITRFDCCYLIDPAHSIEKIKEAIGTKQLLGILLTHAHHDHVDLIGHFDVPIYLHLSDAHLLFEDQYNGYHPKRHPYTRASMHLKYLDDGDVLMLADHQIEALHTPGHTAGGLCFLYQDRLFTGDTLFKHSVGRHDLYSGSLPALKKSVLRLLSLPGNIKIHPGHDGASTIRDEKRLNPFYQKWLAQKSR